jgi:hypothetical protein
MGMFKRMKDMKDMIEAAPGMVAQAQQQGIDAFTWDTAQRGWNERIHRNRAVAQRFNQLYRGV